MRKSGDRNRGAAAALMRRVCGRATAAGMIRGWVGMAGVLVLLLAASTSAAVDSLLPPPLRSIPAVQPSPSPKPSEGRVPVSLRLTNTISTGDGSHPPAATEIRFDLDQHYLLDLSGVERCSGGVHFDIRTKANPCEGSEEIGRGAIKFEVLFPEEEPTTVQGRALAYKGAPGSLAVWAYLSAPVPGFIFIPLKVGFNSPGRYGPKLTATIPEVAGGSGSLTYLGLRFRKGLFSLACPQGLLQSKVTSTFADGDRAGGSLIQTC